VARVLVVDDEEGIREFVAEALEDDGHVVVRAKDGAEASARLRAQAFDLMITDLRMPELDGMTSCARPAPSSRRWRSSS